MNVPSTTAEAALKLPFAGKTVLVTGHGITARRIAGAAHDRGARVGLASAHADSNALHGVAYFAAALDSESAVDSLIDAVVDRLSRLDVVIVVVAAEPLGSIHELSLQQWRRGVVDPLRQLFWLTRRVIEELLADGAGARFVLVLDSSTGGDRNEVVEQALGSFARSFCREYGSRALACNVVVPALGSTATARTHGHAEAIIEHVLFLAGQASSFVNGETLRVELRNQAKEADARAERS